MAVNIRSGRAEYLTVAHAITGDFGTYGESVSKIEYYVNLIL
jgi:hypothetical protein